MRRLPHIPESDRAKPISYDPALRRFILYSDAVQGGLPLISPYDLAHDDLKRLIIERHRRGPDYTVRTFTGETYDREKVIAAIEKETDFGRATLQAEATYVAILVRRISNVLAGR